MSTPHLLVIGASGDVGGGIVDAADARGWSVIAVGRDRARLEALAAGRQHVTVRTGNVSTEGGVAALLAVTDVAALTAVIVTVNPGWKPTPLLGSSYDVTADHLNTYLRPHLLCASAFIPLLRPGSTFIGLGGGMADAVFPRMGAVSMAQAAQRAGYRHLAKEARAYGVRVHEVMIHSMVAGASNREKADPRSLTAAFIGSTVCDLVAQQPDEPTPIVDLVPAPVPTL